MITADNLEEYYVRIGRLKQRYFSGRFEQDLPVFSSHIIHDREIWERRQKDLLEKGSASGPGMLLCAQRVDIYEDGSVELAL